MSTQLERINLSGWPFNVVPDAHSSAIWAGRTKEKRQIHRIVRKMEITPTSNLRIIWANFGMGKTHTLLYMKHLCESGYSSLKPAYAVLPKRSKGFLDVYRAIVEGLLGLTLYEELQSLGRSWKRHLTRHPIFKEFPDIVHAIIGLESDDYKEASLSRQWMTATKGLRISDIRSLGISQRISSPENGIAALTAIMRLLSWESSGYSKTIVMIDEFQRIGQLSPKPTQEINASLHSLFNENPSGLELLLSFSFGRQDNVRFMLSDEILSRANPETISLDHLTVGEARKFVGDLISHYHIKQRPNRFYPFSGDAVDAVLAEIEKTKSITPRRIMHLFNYVLSEWMIDSDNLVNGQIESEFVLSALSDSRFGSLDEDAD